VRLTCYALGDHAPKIVAGRSSRQWMDNFPDRHPYRCLPLNVANAYGWEMLSPIPIDIEWTGGSELDAVRISSEGELLTKWSAYSGFL
jgi:hypothetical protein